MYQPPHMDAIVPHINHLTGDKVISLPYFIAAIIGVIENEDTEVALFISQVDHSVKYTYVMNGVDIGDVLIGFYAHDDVTFDVVIGSTMICSYNMRPKQFVYAIESKFPVPLCVMRYSQVKLIFRKGCGYNVSVVYAFIHSSLCRQLASMSHFFTNDRGEYFEFGDNEFRTYTNHIAPCMIPECTTDPSPAEQMAWAHERTNVIRKELMEVAWHPRRMVEWCLPYDDDIHHM